MASRVWIPPLTFILLPLQGHGGTSVPRTPREKEVLERAGAGLWELYALGTGVSPALDKQKALSRLARAALHPAGGAPPAPGASSDVKTYLPGAPCLTTG